MKILKKILAAAGIICITIGAICMICKVTTIGAILTAIGIIFINTVILLQVQINKRKNDPVSDLQENHAPHADI